MRSQKKSGTDAFSSELRIISLNSFRAEKRVSSSPAATTGGPFFAQSAWEATSTGQALTARLLAAREVWECTHRAELAAARAVDEAEVAAQASLRAFGQEILGDL